MVKGTMRATLLAVLVVVARGFVSGRSLQTEVQPLQGGPLRTLIWADEFNVDGPPNTVSGRAVRDIERQAFQFKIVRV